MIFKMTETEQQNGGFNHGVSLFYNGDSDRQDAVILSGVSHDVAWKLYMDLNQALCNAGLAFSPKQKAANDAVLPDAFANQKIAELKNIGLQQEVKKWKRGFYIVAVLLAVSQWIYLYAPKH